jgi:1-hydroxycarotenoid 3,4-desaturase
MSVDQTIVIGGGVGGLAAALSLAAAGRPVTLLEQHTSVGGKLRQLESAGRLFDAGPTVFTMRWVLDSLFESAGVRLEDRLVLEDSPLLARHSWQDGSRLDLFADLQRSMAAIHDFAGPTQASAYAAFVAESGRIFDTLDRSFMRASRPGPLTLLRRLGLLRAPELLATRPFSTLWRALGQRFSDPRLRQLFARYATYTGSSPFAAPATLMLIAEAERRGVYQLQGGMQALARALEVLIRERGGEVRTGVHVDQILVSGGRVTGVLLADGQRLAADAVIFNGDAAALAAGLLGPGLRRAVPARGLRGARSLSAVTWGMLVAVKGWELAHHTVLFGTDYSDEFACIFGRGTVAGSPTVYLCAQDRLGLDCPPARLGAERLFCLMNAPGRPLDQRELRACESRLWRGFEAHGLAVEVSEGTPWRQAPQDFAALFPATSGALYGRATHGAMGSFARNGASTRIPGLYLAGASVHPGAGVPMAATSGMLAAASVLGR